MAFDLLDLSVQFVTGEEGGSDLLGNTPCLAFLDIGIPDFVQQSGFSGIHIEGRSLFYKTL